jgi:phosphohistidine phosphatase SixA
MLFKELVSQNVVDATDLKLLSESVRNKQTNKQITQQINKQINKQIKTNKQTNK